MTLRMTEANGQALLIPRIEVETYWTSLSADAATVVELYRAHGTSEQFYSELKPVLSEDEGTDLDLERLPSRKFQTNELVLLLGMVAYNLLKLIGQESLREADATIRKQVSRRRVRPPQADDAEPDLSGMSLGETCAVLDAILRTKLPLAQDMAAGIPSIRTDLRGDNPASLFVETSQGWDVSKYCYPKGRSVGREERIIRHKALYALISSVFRGPRLYDRTCGKILMKKVGGLLTRIYDRC